MEDKVNSLKNKDSKSWEDDLYLDRIEFRRKRCKHRWLAIAIDWTTNAFELRNKAEKESPEEYGRGKTIDTVEYQKIIHESEIELQTKSTYMAQENQARIEPSASTHGSLPAPEEPCPECGSEREPLIMPEEDVCATLALPTGLLGVQVASTYEPTNEYTKLRRQWRNR
ncbi:hypothetical protein Cgig2_028161 [Carnegiea gigantea]|uniref:Uncharacterized protein n=1 Tax=Carnegiea gigantea TaxID=171969 RepID=A0A9Q1Q9V8_9CARY|nr:hypothetical protein Cgig2_028161 [Carnegiea gigantea]